MHVGGETRGESHPSSQKCAFTNQLKNNNVTHISNAKAAKHKIWSILCQLQSFLVSKGQIAHAILTIMSTVNLA